MWRNSLQLEKDYKEQEFRESFRNIFHLRTFLKLGLYISGYKPPKLFEEAIILSSEGKRWANIIRKNIKNISLPEIKLALFKTFFHHELFIDLRKTSAEKILNILDSEIRSEKIKFPWVFDRLLYDRFFEMFPVQTRTLSYDETKSLLANTPQGVFQIDNIVIGPFGVLNSISQRYLPPAEDIPLWHCSDITCQALHPVELTSGANKVKEAEEFVLNKAFQDEGPASEWSSFYFHIFEGKGNYYDDFSPQHLPWLIANAFSEIELSHILKKLIEKHPKEFRKRLNKKERLSNIFSGSAESIPKSLTKAKIFQTILIMPDEDIIKELEYLIENGKIKIPPTEIREPRISYRPRNWLDVGCQCSKLGVRFVSGSTDIALARLRQLLKKLYKEEKEISRLIWKVRDVKGESVFEKCDGYLHSEDPKNILKELVLNDPDKIEKTFEFLRYGFFKMPSAQEEAYLIDKILWKLGFDIKDYPLYQKLFWEHLENFLKIVQTHTSYDENDKARIRSAGVNFCVSLEEILDNSLSFITWSLLSDHYKITHFVFNFDDSRQFMANKLNGQPLRKGKPLIMMGDGKNTLYPLSQGFRILSSLCEQVIEDKTDKWKRPANELPGFFNETELLRFPFIHTVLIKDLSEQDVSKVIAFLKYITTELDRSNICDIRNRIEHHGRTFPSKNEIENACGIIRYLINEMEELGICPLIYLKSREISDTYNRQKIFLKNFKGKEIEVCRPSLFRIIGLPGVHIPQVIVPCMHAKDSFEMMRFRLKDSSDYSKIWKEYPKRKTRI